MLKSHRAIKICLLLACLAGIGVFIFSRVFQPIAINVIQTVDAGAQDAILGSRVMKDIRNKLVASGYREGKDFAISFTHAPSTEKDAVSLAKQAYQQTPAVIITLGNLISTAAIAQRIHPDDWILFYSSEDHTGSRISGIKSCGKNYDQVGPELGALLVQILDGKTPTAPTECL